MRGALWLLGGAIFAPLFLVSLVKAGEGFKDGLWERNDLLRSTEISAGVIALYALSQIHYPS